MLILITGGARSGKSSLAVRLAEERGGSQVTYIAPLVPQDEEMAERVRRHRASRPAGWRTIEEPIDLRAALAKAVADGSQAAIIDCLTLWLSNVMEQGWDEERIIAEAETTARAAQQSPSTVIAVTNEVGGGIVPGNALARRFRDVQGRVNQVWAAAGDEALLMVAGLPVRLK